MRTPTLITTHALVSILINLLVRQREGRSCLQKNQELMLGRNRPVPWDVLQIGALGVPPLTSPHAKELAPEASRCSKQAESSRRSAPIKRYLRRGLRHFKPRCFGHKPRPPSLASIGLGFEGLCDLPPLGFRSLLAWESQSQSHPGTWPLRKQAASGSGACWEV